MLRVAKIDQCIEVGDGFENDVATAPAIAAVRAPVLDKALPTERDDTVATVAGFHVNLRLIKEFHRLLVGIPREGGSMVA